jgi:hypothetical protein
MACSKPILPLSRRRASAIGVRIALATFLSIAALPAQPVRAGAQPVPAGTALSGVVFDSLAGLPLNAAVVSLANTDSLLLTPRTTITDSLGRFSIAGLSTGRYLVGFTHPVLDSLGLEVSSRSVSITDTRPRRVDLALPSPTTLRVAFCGPSAIVDSSALILGAARHARDGQTVAGASVVAAWAEYVLERGRFERTTARREVITSEVGTYTHCGAPVGGIIAFSATRDGDSTATIELEIPASGYIRRDLYFGDARVVARTDTALRGVDSVRVDSAPRLTGDGRLRGVVVAEAGGRPLPGARIRILNGTEVRANEAGEWTLTGIPTGTRMLQVRALAHYPVTLPVDVVEGAAPVRVSLQTMQAVMDTVRVTAKRMGANTLLEFLDRKRRAGTGRFLTNEDIQQRAPIFTADLFRMVPGMRLTPSGNNDQQLTMRGGASGQCAPAIFLNRMRMNDITMNDLNAMVRPNDIIGMEMYSAAGAPGEFSDLRGCGSVVIWTR